MIQLVHMQGDNEKAFGDAISKLLFEGHFHHQSMLDTLSSKFPEKTQYNLNNAIRVRMRHDFSEAWQFSEEVSPPSPGCHIATKRGKLIDQVEFLSAEIELSELYFHWQSATVEKIMSTRQSILFALVMGQTNIDELTVDRLISPKNENEVRIVSLQQQRWETLLKLRDIQMERIASKYPESPLEVTLDYEFDFMKQVSQLLREGHFHHEYIVDELRKEYAEVGDFEINRRIRFSVRNIFGDLLSDVEQDQIDYTWMGQTETMFELSARSEELNAKLELLNLKLIFEIYRGLGLSQTSEDSVRTTLIILGYQPTADATSVVMCPEEGYEEWLVNGLRRDLANHVEKLRELESMLKERYGS